MTDVLLLQPPISFTNRRANSGHGTYPIGLAYITAVLLRDGVKVRAINDSMATYSVADLLDLIDAEKVRLLGISALLASIPAVVKLAKAVKERFGDKVHVLLGNAYASIDPGLLDRYPYFDSAIVGEAEGMVTEHVKRILAGERLHGVFTATAPDKLDELPFPAFEQMENTHFEKGGSVPIVGTRGCPYGCGYCARQALSRKVRSRSAENIIAEMRHRLPVTDRFYFQDDSATIHRDHVVELCEGILKSGLKVKFEMTTRLDLLDDEMVKVLKRAGCQRLLVGVESGSERIRTAVIQKNLSDAQILEGMAITHRHKMPVQLMFMVGHPEETRDDIMASVNMPVMIEKAGYTNIEMVGYHMTLPIPGTRYFDWCVQKGQIRPTLIDDYIQGKLGDGYFGHWPYLIPEGFTLADMMEFRKKAAQKFHLRFRYILRRGLTDLRHPRMLWEDMKSAYYVVKQGTSSDISKTEV